MVSLACGKVAATRAQLGLSDSEFAQELSRLLSWEPSADLVLSWERAAAAPPPGEVIAACAILAPSIAPGDTDMDDIAIAAAEVDADRLDLLAEPALVTISSLWDELTARDGAWIPDMPPSEEVAALLHTYGITGDRESGLPAGPGHAREQGVTDPPR